MERIALGQYRGDGGGGGKEKEDILPVLQKAISLRQLRAFVDKVAAEEKVVLGRDGQRIAHEGRAVDDQGRRHPSRDTVWIMKNCIRQSANQIS